jgi:hypothetical protein
VHTSDTHSECASIRVYGTCVPRVPLRLCPGARLRTVGIVVRRDRTYREASESEIRPIEYEEGERGRTSETSGRRAEWHAHNGTRASNEQISINSIPTHRHEILN